MRQIIKGDLLTQDVDAIVNAANSFLRHGGGLAKAIDDAASVPQRGENPFRPTAYDEDLMRLQRHPIPVGGAVVQTATGGLPQKAIIHAVGPIWGGGGFHEGLLLRSAYSRSIEAALLHGFTSIAFPAISAGIFGVPMDVVAKQAARAFSSVRPDAIDITVVLTNDEDVATFTWYANQYGILG